jgi:hypothetical protein
LRVNRTFVDLFKLESKAFAVGKKCYDILNSSLCRTDNYPLEYIKNKRVFDETLQKEWQRMRRSHLPIALLMIEMGKEPEYLTVGKTPLERVVKLLSKLDSIRRSKERESVILEPEKNLSYKYVGQVESIFQNLPKPLEWRSFLAHDLILLTDIPSIVQTASVKHGLNKAKI